MLLLFAAAYFLSGTLSAPPVATPEGKASSDAFILERAVYTFKDATGRFPTGAEGLVVLTGPAPSAPTWQGYYLGKNLLTDPWGNAYLYVPATGSSPPKVLSLGPDGVSGTPDDIGSPWPPRP